MSVGSNGREGGGAEPGLIHHLSSPGTSTARMVSTGGLSGIKCEENMYRTYEEPHARAQSGASELVDARHMRLEGSRTAGHCGGI